jgi:hypothetical protein
MRRVTIRAISEPMNASFFALNGYFEEKWCRPPMG